MAGSTITLDADTFTRANSGSWGTASGGSTWASTLGSPTLSISSNEGHATGITAQAAMQLGSITSVNAEGLVRVRTNNTASSRMGITLRQTATNTFYHGRLSSNANNLTIGKVVAGTNTDLFTTAFTCNINTYYWIRFRAIGTHLAVKAWADGSGEPGTWTLSGTDSSITTAGGFGLTINTGTSSVTWDFDSFTVTDGTLTDTLQVRARIATQITKTLQSRLRLNTKATKTLQARFVLSTGTLASKTLRVRLLLRSQVTKTLQTRLRLTTGVTKTLTARALLRTQITKTLQTRLLLRTQTTRTLQTRFRLVTGVTKTLGTRTRLRTQTTRTLQARFRLTTIKTRTLQIRARLVGQHTGTIQVRAVIGTPGIGSGGFTIWANGTGTFSADSLRVTEYPDPSLSLSTILPRLGATVVSWNALVPGNTTLGIDISYDGVNWTDVTSGNGASFPTLYSQTSPVTDGFGTNTSANYTSTNRAGGSLGTWTFDTTHSRLAATGGVNAIYTYSAMNRADVDFFVDMDRSDAGGVVWRYNDPNNFYYVRICDSLSSVATPNTITLYKVSGGVQTQLGTAATSITYGPPPQVTYGFTRGTYRRFRVSMLVGLITVSMDGVALITYTDGSPLGAGLIGLYNNGGTVGSRYYQLWMTPVGDYVTGTPAGDIVTGKFVYTRARLATTDPSATPQVQDLTTVALAPNIGIGIEIPSVTYVNSPVNKNFDDLAKQCNYFWYIDHATRNAVFQQLGNIPSPWILQSATAGLVSTVELEVSSNFELDAGNTLYRNRQTILGVIDTLTTSATFIGDSSTRSFTLGYPLGAQPTLILNGVTQTVGTKGNVGYQWYYAIGDPVLEQDASGIVMQATDTLSVPNYIGQFVTNVTVDDLAEQAARAIIEGGTGIVEEVEDYTGKGLSKSAAQTLAQQLIDRYAIAGRSLIFDTSRDGLAVGQTLSIFVPEHGIVDGQFLITQIEITLAKGVNDTQVYWYKTTVSELPRQASWAKLIASGLNYTSVSGTNPNV